MNDSASADSRCPEAPEGRCGLCMVGGGQDGAELAEGFVHQRRCRDAAFAPSRADRQRGAA